MTYWKAVVGYRGLYEVSHRGEVRSLDRHIRSPKGSRLTKGQRLKSALVAGYPAVSLAQEGRSIKRYVHDLVLEAFVGPRPRGQQACHHPDPDRTNNRLKNLRWGKPYENAGDHLGRYLTDEDVKEIHRLRDEGWYQQELAEHFSVEQGYISLLLSNQIRSVSEPAQRRRLPRR